MRLTTWSHADPVSSPPSSKVSPQQVQVVDNIHKCVYLNFPRQILAPISPYHCSTYTRMCWTRYGPVQHSFFWFALAITRILRWNKVLEYCEHHRGDPLPPPDAEWATTAGAEVARRKMVISDWDKQFIQCDQELLFEIIQAASYLDIKSLL